MIKKFTDRELAGFCGDLAMILNAGISLEEGLIMMGEGGASKAEAQILARPEY